MKAQKTGGAEKDVSQAATAGKTSEGPDEATASRGSPVRQSQRLTKDGNLPPAPLRRRVPIKRVVFLLITGVALYFVWPKIVLLFSQVPELRTITWFWFVIIALFEAASFACYWGLMRVAVGEKSWFVIATTQLSSNAFSRIVPGGAASGGSVSYQMLTRVGLPPARVLTALTATGLISSAVLMALPVLSIPAIFTGAPVDRSLLRTAQIGIVVFFFILGVGALLLFTERPLEEVGRVAQRMINRLRRHHEPVAELPETLVKERDLIKGVIGDRWWEALLFAGGNWLLDFGVLLAALASTGASPRASLVLLAYVVAALLGMVPFTPGGLGFVEVGLVGTLQLAGVSPAQAVLATLAYRLVAYWLPIPAGLVAYVLYRRRFGEVRERQLARESSSP
ncbi:MAG TPA: flippase-like domain-containing protein [Thermoleophilia bacterium]|nr:flippase-like domain-containing protein [Thermoleophilia bacterium]